MGDKRFKTKFAFIGEHADPWANDGPYVWGENISEALITAQDELDKAQGRNRQGRIVSIKEIPLYSKG